MKAIRVAPSAFVTAVGLCGILLCSELQGESFRNLNFEETIGVQTGIPGWVIPPGIDYLYDLTYAGEGAVTLFTHSYTRLPISPIEGDQSVLMIYDYQGDNATTGGAITQMGDVPANAARIKMLVTDVRGIRVSLNGMNILLTVVEKEVEINLVSGNVSDFAGTTALLRIESPFGEQSDHISAFDSIQFVVPEPGTFWHAGLGFLGLVAWRCLRKR